MESCKLCGERIVASEAFPDGSGSKITCMRCGDYKLSSLAEACSPTDDMRPFLHLLSGVCRRAHERGQLFIVNNALLTDLNAFKANILPKCPQTVPAKCEAIVDHCAMISRFPGHVVTVDPDDDYPLGFCRNALEFRFYVKHLRDTGVIDANLESDANGQISFHLTAQGWQARGRQADESSEKRCFVAMSFAADLKDAYVNGIAPLEAATGFRMIRVDDLEFNEKICDRILLEIRRSHFAIADVTHHRPAVYFEAGFAMGLGLPVIWTCREGELDPKANFDTRQYNHIQWKDPEELRQRLSDRILGTISNAKSP